jgi:hypothetical protein
MRLTKLLSSTIRRISSSRSRRARERSRTQTSSLSCVISAETLENRLMLAAAFSEFCDPNPSVDNAFGQLIIPLSTGNVVITARHDDAGGEDAGAVYLFNGATGELISTMLGSGPNERLSYVRPLNNGNFVVGSPGWDNGDVVDAGAMTLVSGVTGFNGVATAANSLVGSHAEDYVGGGIFPLDNGNFVMASSQWDNDSVTDAGAVTFANGTVGITGEISASTSLVGSSDYDQVGSSITKLSNGNYVVTSQGWDSDELNDVGVVTLVNGTTGTTGVMSAINGVVGATEDDRIGSDGIVALSNGNFVILSRHYDDGSHVDAGAATFGNGVSGISGVVSADNSLVGIRSDDFRSDSHVVALTNGNYVVVSPGWSNGDAMQVGAVTFGSGTAGASGLISAENSLAGTRQEDNVGRGGVTAPAHGNYVVASPNWDNGEIENAGAVTFGDGSTGINGPVSFANSLVGNSESAQVGSGSGSFSCTGVSELTNGNYVVTSPYWGNGDVSNLGAATFASGTTGIVGNVSAANSLVGTQQDDQVGLGLTPLSNGNYVVQSPAWRNGIRRYAGAATFGNGTTGISGTVSTANSLVGTLVEDAVGTVTAFGNGNYVVTSDFWTDSTGTPVGATTWGDGDAGTIGVVSAANSLVGTSYFDGYDVEIVPLGNGHYVQVNRSWNDVSGYSGAVTFRSGTGSTGAVISTTPSLVGPRFASTSNAFSVIVDDINNTFIARHAGREITQIYVGSQTDGFANEGPAINLSLSSATAYEADETQITATVTAAAPVSGDQSVSVSFLGRYFSTTDYQLSSVRVVIPDGQTVGTVTLAIIDDGRFEADEEFSISVVNPSRGIKLGETVRQSVTVIDNTPPLVLNEISRFPDPTDLTIRWNDIGSESYEIWLSRESPSQTRIQVSESLVRDGISFQPAELDVGVYKVWVRGVVSYTPIRTDWAVPQTFEIRPTLIPVPAGFEPRPTFSWNPIPNATSYQIWVSTRTGTITETDIPATTWTPDEDLPTGTIGWWIRPADSRSGGWSARGETNIEGRTSIISPLATTSTNTPAIIWHSITGTSRYAVHLVNADTGEIVTHESNLTSNIFIPATSLANGNYRTWVKAINAATDSFASGVWSPAATFTVGSSG